MVQGIIDIKNTGANECCMNLLAALEKCGVLTPEAASKARAQMPLTPKAMADIIQQGLNDAIERINNRRLRVSEAERQLQHCVQTLLEKGRSMVDVAELFGETEEWVQARLDRIPLCSIA